MSGVSRLLDPTIDAIRLLIREELAPSDQLPTEHELVSRIGVSRATVREAITHLAADGIVEKRWGGGTFVAEPVPRTASGLLSILPGIPGILASTGTDPTVHRFETKALPPDPELFPDTPTAPVVWLLRVLALEGVPVVAIRDLLVAEFNGKRIDVDSLRSADVLVPDVLEQVGVTLHNLELDLWASELDPDGQAALELTAPEPVVEAMGDGYDLDGRRILAVHSKYRTRIVRLRVTAT